MFNIKLTNSISKAVDEIKKAEIKSLTEAALLVHGRAVALTPVKTGLLRDSITYVISGSSADFPDAVKDGETFKFGNNQKVTAKQGEAIIGTVVYYAPYVEYGTRYMKAVPFLVPAYISSLNDIMSIFERNYRI